MNKSFAAPRTIRRIAARRVFDSGNGKSVVLTIGVPQSVPGSDWGCAVQITGLNSIWRRPKYVFGIDGLQALHLAMKCASAVLESTKIRLEFLGQADDLGLPKFLPELPKRERARLEAIVEREATKYWRRLGSAHRRKASRRRKRTTADNT
jgi:hypothetical protein